MGTSSKKKSFLMGKRSLRDLIYPTTASHLVRRDIHSPIINTACAPINAMDDAEVEGNTFHAYSTTTGTASLGELGNVL